MTVAAVTDCPDPAEFVATALTMYAVPGVRPETFIDDPIAEAEIVVDPIDPDVTGAIVTV
jgi:hypothetical protein